MPDEIIAAPAPTESTTAPAAAAPPAEPAATTTEAAPAAPQTHEQITAAAIAAFDEGVASENAAPPVVEPVTPDPATLTATEAGVPVVPPVVPPAAEKPAEPPKEKTADEKIEDEIKALETADGKPMKPSTADRFRELSKRPTEAEVTPLREKAERLDAWQGIIADTQASDDQLAQALSIVKAVNSRDPAQLNVAYDALMVEVTNMAKVLGRELPGLVDPLDAHADLKAEVEAGELPRARALEIIQQRITKGHADQVSQRTQQETQRQTDWTKAAQTALAGDVKAVSDHFQKTDPQFALKLPLLQPALNLIKQNLHPSRWAAAVREAWLQIPQQAVAAPAPAPPPIGAMPLRPTGTNAPVARQPKNPLEALEMGLQEAG